MKETAKHETTQNLGCSTVGSSVKQRIQTRLRPQNLKCISSEMVGNGHAEVGSVSVRIWVGLKWDS